MEINKETGEVKQATKGKGGCVANIPKAATRTYLRAKLSC